MRNTVSRGPLYLVGDTCHINLEFGTQGNDGIVKRYRPQTIPMVRFCLLKCSVAGVMFSHQAKIYPEKQLDRLGILATTIQTALEILSDSGAPDQLLWVYLSLMREHDACYRAFTKKTEADHRDSLWTVAFNNSVVTLRAELKVDMARITTRYSGPRLTCMQTSPTRRGFIDLLITSDRCYTVLEFKNIQIDYLDIEVDRKAKDKRAAKAEKLVAMDWPQILKLRVNSNFHAHTIEAGLGIGRPDASPIGVCSPVPSRPVVEMPGRLQGTL